MNYIIKVLKTIWQWYKADQEMGRRISQLRRQEKALKKAMRLADSRAKATGKKQWVIRTHNGELRVVNRHEIIRLRNAGLFDKKVSLQDFDREALYVAQIDNRKRIKQEIPVYDEKTGNKLN
jgi:hypothetical protein